MKVSKEQAAQNRDRILETAARLFRERGFDGIGVADIMKDAGLTHGGFYGHFDSKQDLMAQACAQALAKSLDHWETAAERSPKNPLRGLVDAYLSTKHRDNPGLGCSLAALGPDAYRQGPLVRRTLTAGMRTLVDILMSALPERSKAARRRQALAAFSAMVGGLILSRAVDDADLSGEILDAVTKSVTE
jgi:TetR/AcrR family transcriptional repressor of nem operon